MLFYNLFPITDIFHTQLALKGTVHRNISSIDLLLRVNDSQVNVILLLRTFKSTFWSEVMRIINYKCCGEQNIRLHPAWLWDLTWCSVKWIRLSINTVDPQTLRRLWNQRAEVLVAAAAQSCLREIWSLPRTFRRLLNHLLFLSTS